MRNDRLSTFRSGFEVELKTNGALSNLKCLMKTPFTASKVLGARGQIECFAVPVKYFAIGRKTEHACVMLTSVDREPSNLLVGA